MLIITQGGDETEENPLLPFAMVEGTLSTLLGHEKSRHAVTRRWDTRAEGCEETCLNVQCMCQ